MSGWAKLPRKILDEDYHIFQSDKVLRVYVFLVCRARYEPATINYKGQVIDLKANELIIGRKVIAEKCKIPETTVENILNQLESNGLIGQIKYRKFRLVSILYDEDWTENGSKMDTKRTHNGSKTVPKRTQVGHINKKKKEEEEGIKNKEDYFNYDQNENNSLIPSFDQVEIIRHPICQYVADNLPNVAKIRNQLTDEQADKLDREFTRAEIINVLMSMENYNGISKKYNTVYLTCLTWLKNRKDNGKQPQRAKTYSDYLRENGVEP